MSKLGMNSSCRSGLRPYQQRVLLLARVRASAGAACSATAYRRPRHGFAGGADNLTDSRMTALPQRRALRPKELNGAPPGVVPGTMEIKDSKSGP
jgi:hypothetical protein